MRPPGRRRQRPRYKRRLCNVDTAAAPDDDGVDVMRITRTRGCQITSNASLLHMVVSTPRNAKLHVFADHRQHAVLTSPLHARLYPFSRALGSLASTPSVINIGIFAVLHSRPQPPALRSRRSYHSKLGSQAAGQPAAASRCPLLELAMMMSTSSRSYVSNLTSWLLGLLSSTRPAGSLCIYIEPPLPIAGV